MSSSFINNEPKAWQHKHSGNNEDYNNKYVEKEQEHHYLIKDEANTQLENSIRKRYNNTNPDIGHL